MTYHCSNCHDEAGCSRCPSATVASLIMGDHLGNRPDQFSSLEEYFEAHHKAATGDLYGVTW